MIGALEIGDNLTAVLMLFCIVLPFCVAAWRSGR